MHSKSKPNEGTLKRVTFDYVYEVLKEKEFNRSHTANVLGISGRTIRNYISEMEKMGYEIEYTTSISIKAAENRTGQKITGSSSLNYEGFASNAQRIAYLDNPRKRFYGS